MNAQRRKTLKTIVGRLEAMERVRQVILDELSEVMDEEMNAFDNLPESLQESERGEKMMECYDIMEGVHDELDCLDLDSLMDQLREICE